MTFLRRVSAVIVLAMGAGLGVAVVAAEPPLFPSGILGNTAARDKDIVAACTSLLQAAEERPLFSMTANPERVCCRLIWQRSFHAPVVIRAEMQSKKTQLYVKVLKYDPASREYQLIRTEVRQPDEWGYASLVGPIKRNKAALWDMPSQDPQPAGLDGSGWTLELLMEGKYKVISRWSPKDGPLYELGRAMIEQAIGGDLIPIY